MNSKINTKDIVFAFRTNRVKGRSYGNGRRIISIPGKVFDGKTICQISSLFADCRDGRPIELVFKCTEISDDASLVVFESLINELFSNSVHEILILRFPKICEGSFNSILLEYSLFSSFKEKSSGNVFLLSSLEFRALFNRSYHIVPSRKGYLRYICNSSDDGAEFAQDAESCLACFPSIKEPFLESLNEVSCEIISNACEHGKAPCISQMKVCDGFYSPEKKPILYVSCSFVSFSDRTISSTLKDSFENDSSHDKAKENVRNAMAYHESLFDDNYDEESFFTLSAFQLGVSARKLNGQGGGGTGLTRLLKELHKNSLAERCYVISGKTCFFFISDSIEVNDDGTVGFNKLGDYFTSIPSSECHHKLPYTFRGTIFNLVFVISKE